MALIRCLRFQRCLPWPSAVGPRCLPWSPVRYLSHLPPVHHNPCASYNTAASPPNSQCGLPVWSPVV
eukprot:14973887-Heterocapsa_arctica.AAC.1